MTNGPLCDARLKSRYDGNCMRVGQEKWGGRCKQHRKIDPAEAKAKRQADFAEMEHRVDRSEATSAFIRTALAHGLGAQTTGAAFERLKAVLAKGIP